MIDFYYAETVRNITRSLLAKFKDMKVYRYNSDRSAIVKIIEVPITFAPVEKTQQDRLQNFTAEPETSGQRYYLQVPRMALVFTGMAFDPSRAIGLQEYRYFRDPGVDENTINSMFQDNQPIPYNYSYTLYLRSDSMSDYLQMIENILPYFAPQLHLRVKEFSFLNIERNLATVLDNVTNDFSDELDKTGQRQLNGAINFTVQGWMFKPFTTAQMVKIVKTRFYAGGDGVFIGDKAYEMSAFHATSAGDPPSGVPTVYNASGYDETNSIYYYISAADLVNP